MEKSQVDLLGALVPSLLKGKHWTSEEAEDYIIRTLKLEVRGARQVLQNALDRFPEQLKNVTIIYRTKK